jgi:hypothetical protein
VACDGNFGDRSDTHTQQAGPVLMHYTVWSVFYLLITDARHKMV